MRKYDIDVIKRRGTNIIDKYLKKGIGWSILPGVSSIALHTLSISMISEINRMAGIDSTKDFAETVFACMMGTALFTPLASIPLFGIGVVNMCLTATGDVYLEAVIDAAEKANEGFGKIEELLKEALKNIDCTDRYKFS